MALAYATKSNGRSVQDDPFSLYVVDSEGPPLVHVSRSRRSEIVIFGRELKLLPPIVLDTGPILLNASQYDNKLEISKIVASRSGEGDTKISTTLDIAEVVKRTANLGATYPDVVAILERADRQKNLPGKLVVDAVPTANSKYLEAVLGKDLTGKRDDAVKRTLGGKLPFRLPRVLRSLRSKAGPPVKKNTSTSASSLASTSDDDPKAADAGTSSATAKDPKTDTADRRCC